MFKQFFKSLCSAGLMISSIFLMVGCSQQTDITSLSQLADKSFAVPTGTAADTLVLSRFPEAKFQYFNTVLDAALAVKTGKADAAAYDEPILRNIAAKNEGLMVLPDMLTTDNYGFAVQPGNYALKEAIDAVVEEMRQNGGYADMHTRWFPQKGNPAAMPEIALSGEGGVLRLGTASVTEPFSFVDGSQQVVGFDIELAQHVAKQQGKTLEVVNMEFGSLIPALMSGKVDMIAACITITEERAQKVLFSEPYYTGGIAALVREVKP